MAQRLHRSSRLLVFGLVAIVSSPFATAQSPKTPPGVADGSETEPAAASTTKDDDRTIKALQDAGVRVSSRGGRLLAVTITEDLQLLDLPHGSTLVSVQLSGIDVTDTAIEELAYLKQLRMLSISRTAVTDAGLSALKEIKGLESLSLSSGEFFTSEGLSELKHIPTLRTLSLRTSAFRGFGARANRSLTIDESVLRSLAEVRQIDSLSLPEVSLSEQAVEAINQCKHLKLLSFTVTDANDDQLKWLGQVAIPYRLMVTRSPDITDEGWKNLAKSRLIGLNIVSTPVTDASFVHFGEMRLLESLAIMPSSDTVSISDAGLKNLYELKALRNLSLRNSSVTEDGAKRLRSALPNLQFTGTGQVDRNAIRPLPSQTQNRMWVTVDPVTGRKNMFLRARVTPAVVEQLTQESNLGTVHAIRGFITDEELSLLADVPMTGLVIDSVTDRGIKSLENHPTLESLILQLLLSRSSSITDSALESVARIPRLTRLRIENAPITDEGVNRLIARLAERGKIKWFDLFKCPKVTDDGLAQIGRLTSLETLLLNNNDSLTSGILKQIAQLTNLNRLDLNGISLDDSDLIHLKSLTKLETLALSNDKSNPQLTDKGLAYISQVPSLRSLTIQDAKITDGGVESLIHLKGLQELGLVRTEITDQGVTELAKNLPNLKHLGLTGTKATDASMKEVGKLTQLEWLSLDETDVGDEGLKQLDRLSKLQDIYINTMNVTNEGHQRLRRDHPATKIWLK